MCQVISDFFIKCVINLSYMLFYKKSETNKEIKQYIVLNISDKNSNKFRLNIYKMELNEKANYLKKMYPKYSDCIDNFIECCNINNDDNYEIFKEKIEEKINIMNESFELYLIALIVKV